MKLFVAPPEYDPHEQSQVRSAIEREDANNFKRGRDLLLAGGEVLVLYSPNGTAYKLQVSNAGALSTAAYL